MIIVRLTGGLCNQMFQYAVARRVSQFNNAILKFDLSEYEKKNQIRTYRLKYFNILENIAIKEEIEKLIGSNNKSTKKILNIISKRNKNHIKEKHFHFDKDILKLHDNIYFDGYWQSEKYFIDIEKTIRQEYVLKSQFNKKLIKKDEYEKIGNCNSISIHVRRGDYDYHTTINNVFGLCSLDYYRKAISRVVEDINNPNFFIFSDDITWTKENLKIDYPTVFIENNKDYEDLVLMSRCKANIIANSSFSWWGAWLNQNKRKIVIAPKNWFRDKSKNTKDLLPKTWIQM